MAPKRNPLQPPYESLDHALRAKRRIFGAELLDAMLHVAIALAADDTQHVDETLANVRPRKREYVRRHAEDLVLFLK